MSWVARRHFVARIQRMQVSGLLFEPFLGVAERWCGMKRQPNSGWAVFFCQPSNADLVTYNASNLHYLANYSISSNLPVTLSVHLFPLCVCPPTNRSALYD